MNECIKMFRKLKKKTLLLILISMLVTFNFVSGESNLYDRIGIIAEHGMHGAVPEENIDLFTGNLTLRFKDIILPGPNGFDLVIWRVYNSKIMRDRLPGSAWGMQQEPYSWVGLGWTMHMGRVHNYDSAQPVIEFPDGRWETAYNNMNGSDYVTRDFLKYDKVNYKLYFKDGTVWTFGAVKTVSYLNSDENVRVVTKIENSYGHEINITYKTGSNPNIDYIVDSMNRKITFLTLNNRLARIQVRNATGGYIYYYYTVGTYSYGGYTKLTTFNPPEIPDSTYEYMSGQADRFELTAVNTSYGGRMEYVHSDHTMYFKVQPLDTRVVSSKRIRFTPGGTLKTWTYNYPTYYNTLTGTAKVEGPEFDTHVTYNALNPSDPYNDGWKTGLINKKWITENDQSEILYSEETEWTYQQICTDLWTILNLNLGPIRAPLLSSVTKTTKGDAESKEEYLYERDMEEYGLVTKIKNYGGTNGTTLKNYKTLEYYFESNSTFASKYMVAPIKKEIVYSDNNSKLKETEFGYFTFTGKTGAIDFIKRWKTGSTYLTWDYNYSSYNPNDITITINLPGSAGTETHRYRYGVQSELKRPGYTEMTRTISTYNSAILSETNQHGGIMYFTYDDLGRIERINLPSGFNDITASWSTNSVTINQGGNSVTKYWDGMGRDTGHIEQGDGITLYYRKNLDDEGRVVSESKGSTNASHLYIYEKNALGNPTKITDPRSKVTNIIYYDDQKNVTDANNHTTSFYYEGLSGLATKLKDPAGLYSYNTYDKIGRLVSVNYNNARTQTYSYNGLDQVTTESHPETGTITYSYDTENNLWKQTWGGITLTNSYNSSNQLSSQSDGSETFSYSYDTKGRVSSVSGSGWGRDQLTYNVFGSLKTERQYISGMPVSAYKTLTYSYDANNNPASITYPDGSVLNYTHNTLNMPETMQYKGKSIISQCAYGINKQPTSITISGNGSVFSGVYKSTGLLESANLSKGGTLYNAVYGYDGIGNVTSITNTTPSLNATFSYDSRDRLTTATYTGGNTYNFTYDHYSNLTNAKKNGLTVFNQYYTSQNRVNNSLYTYDSRGNMTKLPNQNNTWSNRNQLKETKNSQLETTGKYSYNERGLRFKAERMPDPGITVTTPTEGGLYSKGDPLSISWQTVGLSGLVDIKLRSTDGSNGYVIADDYAFNGSPYVYNISSSVEPGQYFVRVKQDDIVGESGNIFIDPISITSPLADERYPTGGTIDIQWTTAGITGDITIALINHTDFGPPVFQVTVPHDSSPYTYQIPTDLLDYDKQFAIQITKDNITKSSGIFWIYPPIDVAQPFGNEVFKRGDQLDVSWQAPGLTGDVKLILRRSDGTDGYVMAESVPVNSSPYSYTIPQTVAQGQYFVRVKQDDFIGESADFLIEPIIINDPQGGETFGAGTPITVAWSTGGISGDVAIKLRRSDGSDGYELVASTPYNSSPITCTIPAEATPAQYFIRVKQGDLIAESADFNVTNPITVTAPSGGETYSRGDTMAIDWSTTGVTGDVRITLRRSDGSNGYVVEDSYAYDGAPYNYTIPTTIEPAQYFVRIKQGDLIGESADFFIEPITVQSPVLSETLYKEIPYTIAWHRIEDIAGNDVSIKLFDATGTNQVKVIHSATTNDGIYKWTVDSDIQAGSYTLQIQTTDLAVTALSPAFDIQERTALVITSPNAGAQWYRGLPQLITWYRNDTLATTQVKIDLYDQAGTTQVYSISTGTDNDGSFEWTVDSSITDGNYTLRLETVDNSENTISQAFSISAPGNLVVTVPYGGEEWQPTETRTISWYSDTSITGTNVKISVFNAAGTQEIKSITTNTANDGSYDWVVDSDIPNGDYVIKVTTIDDLNEDNSDVFSIINSQALALTAPNDYEQLIPGESYLLEWVGSDKISQVKLEFSTDNGSTYRTITERTPNTGYFQWQVPEGFSNHCLVRISDADSVTMVPEELHYNCTFKIKKQESKHSKDQVFTITPGDRQTDLLKLSLVSRNDNTSYMQFAGIITELQGAGSLTHNLHKLQIQVNSKEELLTVKLDDRVILNRISLVGGIKLSPEISFSGPVVLEDISVKVAAQLGNAEELGIYTLLEEDFSNHQTGEHITLIGWEKDRNPDARGPLAGKDKSQRMPGLRVMENDYQDKYLELINEDLNPTTITKRFHIPQHIPFDISDKNFKIGYNNDGMKETMELAPSFDKQPQQDSTTIEDNTDVGLEIFSNLTFDLGAWNLPMPSPGAPVLKSSSLDLNNPLKRSNMTDPRLSSTQTNKTLTTTLVNTYYIWSYDGKIMAEYDHNGNCVKNYLYAGNRLVAEYLPQTGQYYYHTQDQVSSTRIVTDDAGAVVYSSAHGPFGDTQTTWTNSYEPKQQYSGKEREHYSQFDYFGARYYDNATYRFISVDPIRNKDEALANPQLWNLYSYCRNNPITYLDPNGEYDRVKAVQYALKYANSSKTTSQFVNFDGDCANFTSQCVHAGEVNMTNKWFFIKFPFSSPFAKRIQWSHTWTVAHDQYEYFSSSEYSSGEITINSAEKLRQAATGGLVKPGDLLFWDTDRNRRYEHSTMITDIRDGELYYSAHTDSRQNVKVSDHFKNGQIATIVRLKDDIK